MILRYVRGHMAMFISTKGDFLGPSKPKGRMISDCCLQGVVKEEEDINLQKQREIGDIMLLNSFVTNKRFQA